MGKITIRDIYTDQPLNNKIHVNGWIKKKRTSKNLTFVHVNDGSTIKNLQVIIEADTLDEGLLKKMTIGSSVSIKGKLIKSQGKEQNIEVILSSVEVFGETDPATYPIQPKKHTLEFLRSMPHLRFKTNIFSAVFRIRDRLSYAIHQFFHQNHFIYVHTPIITCNDGEGAGALFQVTNLELDKLPNSIDYQKDFFKKKAYLTVTGQLEGEAAALGLGRIYTFGPTFRAEKSNTKRHLAEFWMVEPEIAFYDLEDTTQLAESFLKYIIGYVVDYGKEDLAVLQERVNEQANQEKQAAPVLLDNLKKIIKYKFGKITYTEAVEILKKSKEKFTYPVSWGVDLQAEHEKYLVEKHFKKPVIVTDYPVEIKAFYMKLNSDQKTVAAMDVLFPKIGEIIGGSQREENYEQLKVNIEKNHMNSKSLQWYLETRKFGTAPHSGFGLGFDRLVQFVTGMSNIRDAIPFPRSVNNLF